MKSFQEYMNVDESALWAPRQINTHARAIAKTTDEKNALMSLKNAMQGIASAKQEAAMKKYTKAVGDAISNVIKVKEKAYAEYRKAVEAAGVGDLDRIS